MTDDGTGLGAWAADYYDQQRRSREEQSWSVLLKPSVLGACVAVAGRVVVAPLVLMLMFFATGYLTTGTVFIEADSSTFAFTPKDPSMTGGCVGCYGPCQIMLLKYSVFAESALASGTTFSALARKLPTLTNYDFSSLSDEALALGAAMDANDTICESGTTVWGSVQAVLSGTAQNVWDVVNTLQLDIAPQMKKELELAVAPQNDCVSMWNMMAITRLFQYPTTVGSATFANIPAADINVFPDFTECRPNVAINDGLVGSKLALDTNGEDLLAVTPDILKLFPYNFESSIPAVSRVVEATGTHYGATTVMEPLLRGYYGGCRVRAVNTTGVFIEDTCEISKHWEAYGLMVHSPDDVPLCSTTDVCIHNYYNSLWEWVNEITAAAPNRVAMYLNTSRSRYADTEAISVLPGVVVMQILFMGIISLYQVMSHKRSVLLTQIWAYRCQNGRMQVVYLAQITYHLVYNSDLYMIGLATGTLTLESIANLACCFFAFSYSFVNLLKARSGDQQLDRHFRLVWEAMQIVITVVVVALLRHVQVTPVDWLLSQNGEILRKTTTLGAKYCGLNDSCIVFTVNSLAFILVFSTGLGLVALIISVIANKVAPKTKSVMRAVRLSLTPHQKSYVVQSASGPPASTNEKKAKLPSQDDNEKTLLELTTFEKNCLGAPFSKLFRDCDDMAYVNYKGKRCTTVEALLLTGYLFYGQHVYQASAVMLLLAARLVPRKVLRTFNMLLLRWRVDPEEGTLSYALSCTWPAQRTTGSRPPRQWPNAAWLETMGAACALHQSCSLNAREQWAIAPFSPASCCLNQSI